MQNAENGETNPQKPKSLNSQRSAINSMFFGAAALIGFLLGVSVGLNEITERAKFIATNILSILALIVIVAQSLIYRRQRDIMEGQLRLMRAQTNTLRVQAEISGEQRDLMEGETVRQRAQAIETADLMKGQLEAMKVQGGYMQAQSEAMIGQLKVMENELKATRDSVELAWEGLKTQKRAYLGTNRMNIDLKARKRLAIYLINAGKSPAADVVAKLQVTISTPDDWHERQPANVRALAVGEEEYRFYSTAIYPDSIPVRIGFPLGKHFTDEELTLVAQKKSRLTVNLTLEYQDGFDPGFSYFALTYRGKDSHGFDSWGIFPTESEKEYDQTNPEHPEWKMF